MNGTEKSIIGNDGVERRRYCQVDSWTNKKYVVNPKLKQQIVSLFVGWIKSVCFMIIVHVSLSLTLSSKNIFNKKNDKRKSNDDFKSTALRRYLNNFL